MHRARDSDPDEASRAPVGDALVGNVKLALEATGDGALLYTNQALWTAAQAKARVIFLVLDNAGYAVLKECGDFLGVGHDLPGMEVMGVDYVKLAESFGVEAFRVERYVHLAHAFDRALAADGPILVSIPRRSDASRSAVRLNEESSCPPKTRPWAPTSCRH